MLSTMDITMTNAITSAMLAAGIYALRGKVFGAVRPATAVRLSS
jgi:hypothetical protein